MKTQKIRKIGNSAGVLLPAEGLARLGLKPGAKVRVEVTENRIVILPEVTDRAVKVNAKFAREVDQFLRKHADILEQLT